MFTPECFHRAGAGAEVADRPTDGVLGHGSEGQEKRAAVGKERQLTHEGKALPWQSSDSQSPVVLWLFYTTQTKQRLGRGRGDAGCGGRTCRMWSWPEKYISALALCRIGSCRRRPGVSRAGSCERGCTQDGARHLQGKGKGKCKGNGKSKDPSHREMHVGTR